ncbi:MAG: hypothetical protein KAJ19_26265 [Gammaproteobacteria bacterium]|nr:hypothetical protein [Gammaproteobacteria bacterium]
MKLFAPESSINIYNEGFGSNDLLERKDTGRQLSDLVEKVEDPTVIAIDGEWGSGKSFFLKRWVGAHTHENNGTATTVYFDAFAHDYLEDPLIALTGVIGERFEENNDVKSSERWEKAKDAAAILWRPALRIGLALGTAGVSEVVGGVVDAGLAAGNAELTKASESFWKKEDGKRAAINHFLSALSTLTEPAEDGGNPQKLVVVIDELDRCRPDYALALLEVVKHFFAVPNVHFVLGVNLEELQNSVRSRYGDRVNASLYLQKFISISMRLPNRMETGNKKPIQLAYYSETAIVMGLNEKLVEGVYTHLKRVMPLETLSIRGIQKVLSQIALVPQIPHQFERLVPGYQIVIAGLIVLKVAYPEVYEKARNGKLDISEVYKCFGIGIGEPDQLTNREEVIERVWAEFLAPETNEPDSRWSGLFGPFGISDTENAFGNVIRDYIERISFEEPT